jgi:hypothetical protein
MTKLVPFLLAALAASTLATAAARASTYEPPDPCRAAACKPTPYLNPQPLPPGAHGGGGPGKATVMLNPQPLPPRVHPMGYGPGPRRLNPQPLPPG